MADAALTAFATEARAASPRPSEDLLARVLGDAAAIAAEKRNKAPASRVRVSTAARGGGRGPALVEWLFGWTGSAVAAMVLGLAVGLGVGLEAAPGKLPVLDRAGADLPMALAEADPGILLMDGL
jgi:hypothetical protein